MVNQLYIYVTYVRYYEIAETKSFTAVQSGGTWIQLV